MILGMSLCFLWFNDIMVWNYDSKGEFIVFLLYYLIRKTEKVKGNLISLTDGCEKKWRYIWKFNILSRIKIFC